jgi:protein SCO1/2
MSPTRSYWRGTLIVVFTVLASALVALAGARSGATPPRAAQDMGDQAERLGSFQLVERSGRMISETDLEDRVCIVSFIFTRCQLSCPRITSVMKSLQSRLEGSDVLLVSLSVDPEHDTPQVLDEYARRYEADPQRWWFLTGSRPLIYNLIQRRFKLSVMENPAPDPEGKTEAIAHSERLALVDHGRVVGLFDSNEPSALNALLTQARRGALAGWVRVLPTVNAVLNALCAVLLVVGWSLIRGRGMARDFRANPGVSPVESGSLLRVPRVRGHIACMVLAVLTSAIFLVSYLVYHYQAGSMPFRGQGPIRWLYFTILISHTLLATFGVVPLVFLTLLRAVRRDFARHMSIAATTFPIWVYVSITGVVIYLMLYHLPLASSSPALFG